MQAPRSGPRIMPGATRQETIVCSRVVSDEDLRDASNADNPAMVFALAQSILRQLREAGVREEEALAALRIAELIVPLLRLESGRFMTINT